MHTKLATFVIVLAATTAAGPVQATGGEPTGTTVITHGFQLSGTVPDWCFHLAEAIRVRSGNGRIYEYDASTGSLVDCAHPACGPQGSGRHTVIVFDWADDSNESGEGFSEAAAEALFAGLVEWSRVDPPLVSLDHLHLIGHSRGAVVNSEVGERLIAAGFAAPEQLTSLDPHDSGLFAEGQDLPEEERAWEDFDVNSEHPEYRCAQQPGEPSGICSWAGVGYHDNYWRDEDDWPCLFDPDGKVVPGSSDFDASGLDDFCHSDVHYWYYFTVDTAASTHPETGDPPGLDWFEESSTTCDVVARTSPLARGVDGYNFSRVGGGAVRCPDLPADKQQVHFSFNLAEGLVNGDFEKQGSSATIAGWDFHGGGGTAELATDGDTHLLLDAGQWRLHNRFHLPEGTIAVRFCTRVFDPGVGDSLTVTLHQGAGSRVLLQDHLPTITGWLCVEEEVLEGEWSDTSTIEFRLSNSGGSSSAEVGIDDVGLVLPIFADGFESGDTSRWSTTVP